MERLRARGARADVGHDAANLPEGAEVVVSTAIAAENPELALARERGLPPIHRGALLAELCAEKRLIAIAGTHGKTTTTAMVVWALRATRRGPRLLRRWRGPRPGPRWRAGQCRLGRGRVGGRRGRRVRRQLPRLDPEIAVVTNVEMDHHTRMGLARRAADRGLRRVPAGARGGPAGRPRGRRSTLLEPGGRPDRSQAHERRARESGGRAISLDRPGPAELELAVPGAHNVLNARAALAALELPVSISTRRRGARRLPRSPPAARVQGGAQRRPHI